MIKEQDILNKTNYGLGIYSHVLRKYYPNEDVLCLSGKECAPARNPFNDNKQTLKLMNQDWVFLYNDLELTDFKGNPFDFAEQHYKLSGDELLEQLNDELHLHLGEEFHFHGNKPYTKVMDSQKDTAIVQAPKFSFFKSPVTNIYPEKEMNLVEVYELIKGDAYIAQTDTLRSLVSRDDARRFKANQFDYACFSGIFSKRSDKALLKHSGLLTIDFDHIPKLQQLKEKLLQDEYFDTELMFVSPSGDGLKWIIPIDITENTHQNFFVAISAYIKEVYNIEVDKTGKDVSRACFLPYDPEAYINPIYLTVK